MTPLPREIFKAYDIRGLVGKTLTPDIVRAVGRAVGSLALECGRDTVAIGRDGRLSGPELGGALAEGLAAAGANVVDLGMVATPMTYFAAQHLHTGCSVMVATKENRVVATHGDIKSEVNRGLNCVKGYFLSKIMYGHDRLTSPMLRKTNGKYDKNGEFTPVSWDEAFDEIVTTNNT